MLIIIHLVGRGNMQFLEEYKQYNLFRAVESGEVFYTAYPNIWSDGDRLCANSLNELKHKIDLTK